MDNQEKLASTYLSLKDNTTRMEHKPQITMNRRTQITILIDNANIPIRGHNLKIICTYVSNIKNKMNSLG